MSGTKILESMLQLEEPKTSKKAPVKAAAKKAPAKKAAPKASEKAPEKAPRMKKEGLRKPQVRILQALSKAKGPLSRAEISNKGAVDTAMLNSYIGAHDEEVRKRNDEKVMPSLLTLGFVKAEQHDIDGRDTVVYSISAAGRKALEKVS